MRRSLSGIALVPLGAAALVVWLGFDAGGFFAGGTGRAVLAAGVVLLLWLLLVRRPLEGLSRPLALVIVALAAFAGWTLLSGSWSHAGARALVEFDRALLYVLAVAVAGLAGARAVSRRWMARLVAAALVVVCTCGLVTRLLPRVWPVTPTVHPDRLSYPVTYWNTLGMLAAIAAVLCLHLAASERERAIVRSLAAAAVPVTLTTLFFTFSRGAIAALPVGVVAYLVAGRPRGLASALLAIVPASVVAVVVSYGSDAVVKEIRPTDAAVAQGRTLAIVVVACAVAAAALQWWLRPVDARVSRLRPRIAIGRRAAIAIGAAAVVLVVAAGAAANVPHAVEHQIDRFTRSEAVPSSGDLRSRLTDVGNNGRIDHWRVALKGFQQHPVTGTGAGTYALLWDRYRHLDFDVNDGHSLYVEVLGELGIVGAVLIVTAVLTLLVGCALRARGPDRALAGVAFAVVLMWALRAGIDWDWEMPVLTLPVLALGAATIARGAPTAAVTRPWPGRVPRLLAGIALLALLVTPLALVRSQNHLDAAAADVHEQRCGDAVGAALDSTRAVSVRPEPFQILALCDVRLGRGDLALNAIRSARLRDPGNWQISYEQAIIRASQGLDPRPALRRAHQQNPLSDVVDSALKRFHTSDPNAWRRRALSSPIVL